jgi:succinate dehydrogenase / fumarate reductase flavoprotein subunit
VVPTIHYQMGGIPTNYHGQVVAPRGGNPNAVVDGLYAIGECACVSVHGANRLGTNSLLDLVVFGRAAGNHIVESRLKDGIQRPLPAWAGDATLARLSRLDGSASGENTQEVANEIRRTMQAHCGVFRTSDLLAQGVTRIMELAQQAARVHIKDKSKVFNTARPPRRPSFRPRPARRAAAPTRTATSRPATTPTGSGTHSSTPRATASTTSRST